MYNASSWVFYEKESCFILDAIEELCNTVVQKHHQESDKKYILFEFCETQQPV